MDGVISTCEGVLRPGVGVCPRVWAWFDLCVGIGDGPDPGHGPRGRPRTLHPLGQAEHGQSQVVAHPPRGDLGQGAGRGFSFPYCPWWGGPWGEHGVGPFFEPLWAGGCCCGSHYVVVLALEDCTPDLRRGVVAVCRWGGAVVVGGRGGGRRRGWCCGFVRWPVPIVLRGSGLLGVPSPLGLVVGVWSLDV